MQPAVIAGRAARATLCLSLMFLALGCSEAAQRPGDPLKKVTFDLSQLDDDGLFGPPDGRRALSYEFCIPDTPERAAEVSSIDPTAQCMPGSRGRIGCGKDESLCVGSTHQEGFRTVLRKLAALEYVARIDEAFFE